MTKSGEGYARVEKNARARVFPDSVVAAPAVNVAAPADNVAAPAWACNGKHQHVPFPVEICVTIVF